jgi:hypothetical protein
VLLVVHRPNDPAWARNRIRLTRLESPAATPLLVGHWRVNACFLVRLHFCELLCLFIVYAARNCHCLRPSYSLLSLPPAQRRPLLHPVTMG